MGEPLVPQVHIGHERSFLVRTVRLGGRLETVQAVADLALGHDLAVLLDCARVLFENTVPAVPTDGADRQHVERHV